MSKRKKRTLRARVVRLEGSQDGLRWGFIAFSDRRHHNFCYDLFTGVVRLYSDARLGHRLSYVKTESRIAVATRAVQALLPPLRKALAA